MKLRNYFYAILCGLTVTVGFSSCEDDDDEWNWKDAGSAVEMSRTRAFILNEGSYGMNNAHINYFDWKTDELNKNDIFLAQNGQQIGDTGQDMIEYNGFIYLVVFNSNYIAKLNGVGKEIGRVSFADKTELGQVRYITANDGFLYVTSYGGYVSKINANTLEIVGSVKVGNNPEQIIESDGYIYCVNSGWGYDNRLSVINEKTFTLVENVTIMENPESIVETDGYIVIQGYGGAYPDYTYPVDIYNPKTKTCTNIGTGTAITAEDGILYVVNTTTDYSTTPYSGKTEVWSYNLKTGKKTENVLQLPNEIKNGCAYGISINEETNHVYVLGTNFIWGDGNVYHFDNKGNYIGSFTSGGQCPKKIVFLD